MLAESTEEPPEDSVEIGRLSVAMNEGVGQLAERSRDLLRQRYESGQNTTSLSTVFGMTPEAIRQSLARIRATVRQCIESKLARP